MIDFSKVNWIIIPEGKANKITRDSDGAVLWKTGSKNWVPFSTEADGVTIYNNGLGYKDGYRVRSGGEEAESTSGTATGFIPIKRGDIVRIYPAFENYNTNNAINFADMNFVNLGQITDTGQAYGICAGKTSTYFTSVINNMSVLNYTDSMDQTIAYVRITNLLYKIDSGSEMIVNIEETTPTSKYANLLPFAKDTDRVTFYNGIGYKTTTRLSSSGSAVSQTGMCASGFIPAKEGDILRIKGTMPKQGTASYVIAYDSSNTKTNHQSFPQHTSGSDWVANANHPWLTYEDGVLVIPLVSEYFGTGFNAIRFSAGTIDANTIATINQEIV